MRSFTCDASYSRFAIAVLSLSREAESLSPSLFLLFIWASNHGRIFGLLMLPMSDGHVFVVCGAMWTDL